VADRFQILTLDGGGIRGLFSAALLAAMEEDLGTRIDQHFDLIAGTSTGGIVAIALGLGIRPRAIVDFYLQHGPKIFANPVRLRSAQHWAFRKYSTAPLEKALQDTFQGAAFGDSTKRLVITSYNLGADDVYLFRTPHHERLRRDYKVPAWQVARATTAAPTFFGAFRGVDGLRLVDGGVWANNPAMVALAESYGTLGVPLTDTWLLSVGTYDAVQNRPRYLDKGGRLAWASSAPDVLLRATSIGVRNQADFLLDRARFLRIDPKVPAEDVALDKVKSAADLIGRARHFSRIEMPTVQARFLSHIAPAFVPLYRSA
jgi:patatin-like phospholipase/acyl hydrolase